MMNRPPVNELVEKAGSRYRQQADADKKAPPVTGGIRLAAEAPPAAAGVRQRLSP